MKLYSVCFESAFPVLSIRIQLSCCFLSASSVVHKYFFTERQFQGVPHNEQACQARAMAHSSYQ